MAGKKKAKKAATERNESSPTEETISPAGITPNLLRHLISALPDELRSELLNEMFGGADPNAFPTREKPRTKAQREVDRLLEEARLQLTCQTALPFLSQAEAVARKAVGKRLEKLAGRLGDDPAGQSYLEVKVELAHALSAAGQREAALEHVAEAFRLDPDDPAGARLLWLAALLDLAKNDEAERLLDEHCPEPWASWTFGRLLIGLRRGERGRESEAQLKLAHDQNPYVLSLLLGERMPEAIMAFEIESGSDEEAQEYAADFLASWKDTPGAISWLRDAARRLALEIQLPDEEPAAAQRRLSARDYARMPPHAHPTWIVGLHEMPSIQSPGDDRPRTHWLTFAVSPESELIGFDMSTRKPSAREMWASLAEFMQDERQPGRPTTMLVHPPELLGKLKKAAERAHVALAHNDDAPQLEAMLGQLYERMQGGAQAAQALAPDAIRQAPLDVDEVWEAAVVQLDQWLNLGGHSLRPWVALVMSRASGAILWHELFMDAPPANALGSAVRMAIAHPTVGPARRPRQVFVRDADEALSLGSLSDEAGFECLVEPTLSLVNDAIAHVTQELLGDGPPVVLTKAAGVQPDDLECYYTSAAAYYRAQPWKRFAMDELIGLDRQQPAGSRCYALVMGQSGITQGLAIYERLADIRELFALQTDEPVAYDSFSVMFGEDSSIAPADLDAIEQFGWPIATPEAYPDALRIFPGTRVETPTAAELRFLAAALQAITELSNAPDTKSCAATVGGTSVLATRLGPVDVVQA